MLKPNLIYRLIFFLLIISGRYQFISKSFTLTLLSLSPLLSTYNILESKIKLGFRDNFAFKLENELRIFFLKYDHNRHYRFTLR